LASIPRRVESALHAYSTIASLIQEAITVASVDGEGLTAEIVAEILGVDEKRIFSSVERIARISIPVG